VLLAVSELDAVMVGVTDGLAPTVSDTLALDVALGVSLAVPVAVSDEVAVSLAEALWVEDQEGVGGGLSGVSDGVCVPEEVALAEVLQPRLARDGEESEGGYKWRCAGMKDDPLMTSLSFALC
jgi:hypothetical protein